MAVRLYLRQSFVEVCEVQPPEGGRTRYIYTYEGKEILKDEHGDWYYQLPRLHDAVPAALLPYVKNFSAMVKFPMTPRRRMGIYHFEDCTARLDSSDNTTYEMCIYGTDFHKAGVLYRKIRSGEIEPTEDWSAETEPASPLEHIGETATQIYLALTSGEVAVPKELLTAIYTTNMLLAEVLGVTAPERFKMQTAEETVLRHSPENLLRKLAERRS